MAKKMPYVIKDECTACNACVDELPQVFRVDEDGLAEVYQWDPNEVSEEEIEAVMEACPGACIVWKEVEE